MLEGFEQTDEKFLLINWVTLAADLLQNNPFGTEFTFPIFCISGIEESAGGGDSSPTAGKLLIIEHGSGFNPARH